MIIDSNIEMVKSNGRFFVNGKEVTPADGMKMAEVINFYEKMRGCKIVDRPALMSNPSFRSAYPFMVSLIFPSENSADSEAVEVEEVIIELTEEQKKEIVTNGIAHLMDFFKEFDFEPNFRFINTLAISLNQNENSAKNYISSYFELIDSPYCNEINAKMGSKEFSNLLNEIGTIAPSKVVNHRFNLYYGSQGTGKTTIAMRESGSSPIVCNSSMLPSDIMEDFVFVDGKATYKPSAFWRAMVEGRTIVMDEINLLPYDTLRFLQGILDNKKTITYKGNDIEIDDNFKIIGTMNLTVNGMTYGLPEPLVDRCAVAKKFTLSAKDLLSAIE